GLRDERGQREQVGLTGQVDKRPLQSRLNFRKMILLDRRPSTRQDKIDIVLLARLFDHFRPTLRFPKLFCPRRTGMEDDKSIVDLMSGAQCACLRARLLGKMQLNRGWFVLNSERLEQLQVVIDCVQLPNGRSYKCVVGPRTKCRSL